MAAKTQLAIVPALGLEIAMGLAAISWAHYRSITLHFGYSAYAFLLAIFFSLILFCINATVLHIAQESSRPFLRSLIDFTSTYIKPLADALTPFEIVALSISAGFGEELFFRGVLANEWGIFLSSTMFAILHFGRHIIHYWFLGIIYFLIGIFFAEVYQITSSLLCVIICHSIYDIMAFFYARRITV